jgi:hypothetical protein
VNSAYIKPSDVMVSSLTFSKQKEKSLLDMFESPLFDIHMLFKYLHGSKKPHITEYLVNKLYRENRHQVSLMDFYLPQLCKMCVSKPTELALSIKRFVF